MAAAVLPTLGITLSNPFQMASHQRNNSKAVVQPTASSSRCAQPSTSSNLSSTPDMPESSTKAFKRIRSSLEQSIRTATRSKTKPPPPAADDFGTVTVKGKEKVTREDVPKEKERSKMLRRLESKVGFRRSGPVTPSPSPVPPVGSRQHDGDRDPKAQAAGLTAFKAPSLRQGSMSSPALHLYSQALPSPKSQSAVPASSSSTSAALVSPTRQRTRRASVQPSSRDISGPSALASKRDARSNGIAASGSASKDSSREHRQGKSRPSPLLPSSNSTPSLLTTTRGATPSPAPATPTRRNQELPSPPDTPTPTSRGHLAYGSKRAAASTSHLPDSAPASPTAVRGASPQLRARSPTKTPVASPVQRGAGSSSSSHLPPSSPTAVPRRPSVDTQRRTSQSPGRAGASSPTSPLRSRATSPTQRGRAYSPTYAQNRHFNISTTSLSGPSNPEYREVIRSATSLLCKEFTKPPPHLGKSTAGAREWEEIEVRMRALIRLERIWGKSSGTGSSTQLHNIGGMSSSGLSAAGEDRERRLFSEALRDGYVLCQLVNKHRPNAIAHVDHREDGFVKTSNVTKFLASCSSHGLRADELFNRDDLPQSTPESLARVARTIIALVKLIDIPVPDRSKILVGQKKPTEARTGPYGHGSSSRAASSTPNLSVAQMQRSTSPTGPSTPSSRKRWSPPSPSLPTVRSDSAGEGASGSSANGHTAKSADPTSGRDTPVGAHEQKVDDVPPVMKPPPRSPLRARSISKPVDDGNLFTPYRGNGAPLERASVADSTRASIGESVRASVTESAVRQSVASSNITETTTYSSLLDIRQNSSSSHNKYGTIRTITTEATSLDSPSLTRTEGSSVAASLADEMVRKRGMDSGAKYGIRERRPSETAIVDLSRVAEEVEETSISGSSSRDGNQRSKEKSIQEEAEKKAEKKPQIRLGKAKWPDDFLDAFQSPPSPTRPIPIKSPTPDRDHDSASPLSISPPRKLAVVGRRNESVESLPQFPRRPTHRARHSVDAPVLAPKDSILRRDVSPDGLPSNRLMLRRSSSKGPQRNGVYVPRGNDSDPRSSREDGDSPIPFPRAVSGEHPAPPYPASPTTSSSSDDRQGDNSDKPRLPRGRFQSEIEGASARRRTRPNSYDELGNKPRRTRFESMVNLGVGIGSSNASASDLMSRDSLDGSAVRQTLIVREEGKPPTNFQLGNCIGRGQFGSVYRALNLNTGQMVAVKRIRLEGLKEEEVTQLMREVDLVKSLSHPSIVKYEGMARDENTLSIVLEYVENGSLGQTLKAFGKLNERLVASYVVKILEGLYYLHQSDVVHCDLKAANILTTKNGNVKLSDFGVSLNLRAMEREIKDVAGTPNWMAPEVIELKGASTKSDIWSLACTIIELLTGRPPYGDIANSMAVMYRIVEDDMPPIPDGCSEHLQNFLKLCFNKEPTQRPNAETLFEHDWLKKNWGLHKELRPQDSIPFLRRVSADLHKSDAVRFLSQVDIPVADSPVSESPRFDEFFSGSPGGIGRRLSNGLPPPRGLSDGDPISPREHSFVKTTFSKSMTCRVCLLNVKKGAVLCEQCSLVAHSKCAINAPPTCDLRAQLLLYAQYAEKGPPGSSYTNPLEIVNGGINIPTSPTSDGSFSVPTPRVSLDGPPPASTTPSHGTPPHPPTAFKFMATAFKRSRGSLSPELGHASPSPPPSGPPADIRSGRKLSKRQSALKRNTGRTHSMSSVSTTPNTSSMRSAETAAESFSSGRGAGRASATDTDAGKRSRLSGGGSEGLRSSQMTTFSGVSSAADQQANGVPGDMPPETRRHKRDRESKSSSNCTVQ